MIIVATRKCLYLFLFLLHLRNIKNAVTFRYFKCGIKYCGAKVHNVAAYCNSVSQKEIVKLLSLIFLDFLFQTFKMMKIHNVVWEMAIKTLEEHNASDISTMFWRQRCRKISCSHHLFCGRFTLMAHFSVQPIVICTPLYFCKNFNFLSIS